MFIALAIRTIKPWQCVLCRTYSRLARSSKESQGSTSKKERPHLLSIKSLPYFSCAAFQQSTHTHHHYPTRRKSHFKCTLSLIYCYQSYINMYNNILMNKSNNTIHVFFVWQGSYLIVFLLQHQVAEVATSLHTYIRLVYFQQCTVLLPCLLHILQQNPLMDPPLAQPSIYFLMYWAQYSTEQKSTSSFLPSHHKCFVLYIAG